MGDLIETLRFAAERSKLSADNDGYLCPVTIRDALDAAATIERLTLELAEARELAQLFSQASRRSDLARRLTAEARAAAIEDAKGAATKAAYEALKDLAAAKPGGNQIAVGLLSPEHSAVVVAIEKAIGALAAKPTRQADDRDHRQRVAAEWCAAAFGAGHASSLPQRGIRLLEEAAEAAQAAGCAREMAHRLIDHVWDRPPGALEQELGGVGLTLLALANAAGLSADAAEAKELARVLAKPLAHFAARNAAKNAAGFNVADGTLPARESEAP